MSATIITSHSRRRALMTVATAHKPTTIEPLLSRTFTFIPTIVITGTGLGDHESQDNLD